MKERLALVAGRLMNRLAHALEHHPKHVTAAVAALMLGGAGGAFAVASASDAGGAALPPAREVIEPVATLPLQQQAEALDAHRFNLFRSDVTRSSDTAEALLARLGVNDAAAAAFLRREPAFRTQVLAHAGRTATAEASDTHELLKLTSRWVFDHSQRFNRLVIQRTADGRFTSRIETASLQPALRMGSGTLARSLFEATDAAGVPDEITRQFVDIFDGDVDFSRGLRRGDRFSIVYEVLEGDGEPLRMGRVLSAELESRGRLHQALWFQEPGMKGGYFDLEGRSLERSFLASPMETTRITSGFAMRMHPVLHEWKAHMGVDYGGPIGAPVRSIGDGIVLSAGIQGAYGNVVVIDHGRGDTTLYAHLNRIDVRPGQPVLRGQRIGGLGATGRVTGPHLHFEFRENGVHKDPLLAVRNNQAPVLSARAKADFDRLAQSMRQQFAAASATSLVASAE